MRVRATASEGQSTPPECPVGRTTWKRALRLLKKFGPDRALELIDQRAWKAFERGDDNTSRRWRDLMIVIHAAQEDEQLPWESRH